MIKKEFNSADKLREWLVTSSSVVIFSITLTNDLNALSISTNNSLLLAKAMEARPSEYPDGSYLVLYENIEIEDKAELDYSKMVMVIAMEATLASNGSKIGGLKPLINELSDFDYCCTSNEIHPAFQVAGLWIVEPKAPDDMKKLVSILEKYAVAYAFNDGSGFMTLANFRVNKKGMSILPDLNID